MKIAVHQRVPAVDTYRAERVRSLYNVDTETGCRFDLEVDLPVGELEGSDDNWQIGVVVGPSGSGKTSIGRQLVDQCGFQFWTGGDWPHDEPIIEAIGPAHDFDEVAGALSQVGLGSVPSWLRPYHVLSNGEQFRAGMARLVVAGNDRVILDEFTSVLDRQIAKIGAMAFAKSWRRLRNKPRVVLLTPHHDILQWVQPDWILDTGSGDLAVGPECLQPGGRAADDQPPGVRGWVGLVEA